MEVLEIPHFALTIGGMTTLLVCLLMMVTKDWHGAFTLDSHEGVQKAHVHPTPRVGGIAIMVGLIAGWLVAPANVASLLGGMLLAGLPAFVFGLAEDLTKRVGVRERLIATIASGALAYVITGVSLTRLDILGLDTLLAFMPVSVLFTAFAIGGVANSINIIDGFNGLAAGTILICLSALGLIAYQAGDSSVAKLCFILGGVTAGFLIVNFPMGKIFLGDGGAYLMGFLLGWIAVLIPSRNPGVSPWASLLALGYPVLEVLFSVYRRRLHDLHPGSPDRLHFHSLIKVRVVRSFFGNWPLVYRNAMVSPFAWAFAIVPASLGVLFAKHTQWLMLSALFSAALYAFLYGRLERRSKVRDR